MARIDGRFRPALDPGASSITLSILLLVAGLIVPSRCEAAKLSQFLTRKDLSRPVLLDQNGTQLQLPSPSHRHPNLPAGSTPTYLALPLYGGEHLPIATVSLNSGAQAGTSGIGPLDLNTVVKTELDSALNSSGMAAVEAPGQNYLVEYLPHLIRARLEAGSTSPRSDGQKASNSTSSLSKLLTASQWQKWANSGLSDLKKLLNINSSGSSPATSTKNPTPKIEAQVLGSDTQGTETGRVLPPAIPEPSGWMIFTFLLGASALGSSAWRRQKRKAV
jgi:hypothetical protein